MYNGEDAFTADPASISIFDLAVIEHSGFVQLDGSTVDRLCKAVRGISTDYGAWTVVLTEFHQGGSIPSMIFPQPHKVGILECLRWT